MSYKNNLRDDGMDKMDILKETVEETKKEIDTKKEEYGEGDKERIYFEGCTVAYDTVLDMIERIEEEMEGTIK